VHALYSLTAAQTEYNKAFLAAAAEQDRISVHAARPTADDLSLQNAIIADKFMQRILLRNFIATK
jgi:hypothetical protein